MEIIPLAAPSWKLVWRRYAPLVLFLAVALAFIMLAPSLGYAASDEPPTPATGTEVEQTTFKLPASTVLYVTAVILPLVGGVLMRWTENNTVRTAIGLVLNALNALFVTATTADGDAIFSASLVNNFIISTVISLGVLLGIYKKFEVRGQTIDARLKGEPAPPAA